MWQAGRRGIIGAMNESPAATILILAGDESTARRWARMLEDPQTRIAFAPEDLPKKGRPDLILTDGSLTTHTKEADALNERPPTPGLENEFFEPAGVVRIGSPGEADVLLPADVAPRELRLACRLLAEIVRLRRKAHRSVEIRQRLSEEALTDPLTRMPNRRAWDQALRGRLAAAADAAAWSGPQRFLCLAILDLDHFKRVNDAHGHGVGDEVLRAAGAGIVSGLRENDFACRLGGDEFGLLLLVPHESAAESVVDRVRAVVPSRLADSGTHIVTASAGYHVVSAGSQTAPLPSPDSLFAAADAALRQAKQQGRDRTVGGTKETARRNASQRNELHRP